VIPCPGPCGSGTYCNEGTGQCVPCLNTERLRFTPPEPLNLAPGARWPRPLDGNGMVYVAPRTNGVPGPWATENFENNPGQPMKSVSNTQSAEDEGPPLTTDRPEQAPFLGALQGGGSTPPWNNTYNFTFDRTLANGRRVLRRGKWNNVPANFYQLWWSSTLTSPYNTETSDNYSPAVVNSTGRAFWMTTRFGGTPTLATGVFGGNSPASPLPVTLSLEGGCTTEDMAPWINAAGDLLALSLRNNPAGCTPGRDPWVVMVNASGQLIGQVPPRRLEDLASPDPGHDDGEVAFSEDLC
jgi:hypothetical protein